MTDNTILFIHQDSKKENKFESKLKENYEILSWPITSKGLYREVPECSFILIAVDDLTSKDYEKLESFLLIFPDSWVSVVLLGSKTFLKGFRQNVKYPAAEEIDTMKEEFSLTDSINSYIKKLDQQNTKLVTAANSSNAVLAVYSPANDERIKFTNLFREMCNVNTYESDYELLLGMSDNPPDTILISYSAAITDDYKILRTLRGNAKTSNTPLILFGPSISQFQFQDLLPYKPNGYLVKGSSDADTISIVSSHLKKN